MKTRQNRGILSFLAVLLAASFMGGCGNSGDSTSADEMLIDEPEEIFADDVEEIFGDSLVTDIVPENTGEAFEDASRETEPVSGDSRNSGKVLRIVCRNEDFRNAFETIYGTENLPDGIELEFTYLSSDPYEHIYELNELLSADTDEPVDIFLTESHNCRVFNDSGFTLPLSAAGITSAYTEMMFPYTIELGTSSEGILKSVSYQAETGVFAYRRDIALEVFGNDDPEYVHELITYDWEGTAEALAEKGYYIIPSVTDAFRPYSQRRSMPWLNDDGSVTIDPMLRNWAEDMKNFREKGYIPDYQQWSEEWSGELTTSGKTFGTFFSSWGSESILEVYDSYGNGGAGKWGICVPPSPYFWGGNYLNISSKTDNLDLCGEILKKFISDEEALADYSVKQRDFCNNRSAMQKVIGSGEAYSEFLAQNSYEIYYAAAEEIRAGVEYSSEYDVEIETVFQANMFDYIYGPYTYEDAEGFVHVYAELAFDERRTVL